MSLSRPPQRAVTGDGRRRAAAAFARVLSPRGALSLQKVDGAFTFALRAALAMALAALPVVAAGRADLSVYGMMGAFTTTFGRNLPYRRRARALAAVAVAMTACVGLGSLLAAVARPWEGDLGAIVVVAATAVVAGLAKYACDATRLGGLGAILLLFSFAVSANAHTTLGEVLPRTGLAAAGAALAWVLAVLGRFVHPDRPERLAVAGALRSLAELMDAARGGTGRSRQRATAAVLQAYHSLGLAPPTDGDRVSRDAATVQLTDLSWTILIDSSVRLPHDPAELAGLLRTQADLLADRRLTNPPVLPDLSAHTPVTSGRRRHRWQRTTPVDPAALRAWILVRGRPGGHTPMAVLVVPAVRMFLGTLVAGGVAVGLGLGHGYWAAISAAAVLHAVNVRTTMQRAVQRTLGTAVGLLIALGVLAGHPEPALLALVVVILEFLLEYMVVRNYGLGVVFLTPLALLLSDLADPTSPEALIFDRGLGSLLGIVVGLACSLLVVHDQAAVRVERALAACSDATRRAERALAATRPVHPVIPVRLAVTVVELRDADDAAAGELWSAGIDPAALAAAEQRAYLLLARLLHH
ncbi:FUSC family protein [Streptomyces sp. LaPpAH-108]|uniref:FUSC family protein n=1 Tax=Streptomyces sp. LaPpAH-108 TaxID=1155714 RepID=UPI000374FF65|nr:FUSC family protein [Streptomyces sp. LaPpAH-108]